MWVVHKHIIKESVTQKGCRSLLSSVWGPGAWSSGWVRGGTPPPPEQSVHRAAWPVKDAGGPCRSRAELTAGARPRLSTAAVRPREASQTLPAACQTGPGMSNGEQCSRMEGTPGATCSSPRTAQLRQRALDRPFWTKVQSGNRLCAFDTQSHWVSVKTVSWIQPSPTSRPCP